LKINELTAGICWKIQKLGFESLRLRFSFVDFQRFAKVIFENLKDRKLFSQSCIRLVRKTDEIELISINGAASGRLYKPSTNTLERF